MIKMMRKIKSKSINYKKITISVILILLLMMFWLVTTATAQGPVQWSAPVNLSNTQSSSTYPDVVTDPYGYIHVFWSENLDGPPVDPQEMGQEDSNSILYIRGDNQSWSEPIDIFFTQGGDEYKFPSAALDSAGILHLVWRSTGGILYSSAPAHQAGRVQAWQPVQFLAPAQAQEPARLFIDKNDILHLVFSAWANTQYGEKDGNIYYIQSKDGGQNWSEPIQLSEVSSAVQTFASSYDIAIDTQNKIHIVWQLSESPSFTGSSIHYIYSKDGGHSWSVPIEMAHRAENDNWASAPVIYALPPTEIHLTWVCGELPHRCHCWSQDGGLNWLPAVELFGEMHSMAGRDVLTVDGTGNLLWFAQLRYPNAIYYSQWLGGRWTDLQMAHGGLLQGGHYSKVAVSRGNQLNLVTVEQEMKEIYYIQGLTSGPPIELLPTPTTKPTATPTVEAVTATPNQNQIIQSTIATPQAALTLDDDASFAQQSPSYGILIGLLPVLGLIIVVVTSKIWFTRR
jgi:hypothetical protein